MTNNKPDCFHYFGSSKVRWLTICIHGWATDWRSKGLFTDLAEQLAAAGGGCLLFDLNDYDHAGHATLSRLSQQVARLQEMIELGAGLQPDAAVRLLGHSLGCITVLDYLRQGIIKPDRILLLAPAIGQPTLQLKKYLQRRPDSRFEADGRISFKRRNGTTTTLAAGYLEELDFNLGHLYRDVLPSYPGQYKLIVAGEDQGRQTPEAQAVLKDLQAQTLIGADHNFSRHRSELGQIASRYLAT